MNMFTRFQNYMLEEEFKLVYTKSKVDIINYVDIPHFDSSKIMIRCENQTIQVIGSNLSITKLLKDELLIEGKISKIELG